MANVLNRTTKVYSTSVHTPDYPSADWVIFPRSGSDLTLVTAGVAPQYWKINVDDTVSEMTQTEKDAIDDASANLDSLKQSRYAGIDDKTQDLISSGHTFSSKQFSLSENAQRYITGLKQAVDASILTPPIDVTTMDDDTYALADTAAVTSFYSNALGTMKTHLDSGRALKKQIYDATTKSAIDAITDSR